MLGELGDGAFGTVLKAEVTDTGEVVAIKRLKKQYSSWDECLALREVAALTKLKHPNIVRWACRLPLAHYFPCNFSRKYI